MLNQDSAPSSAASLAQPFALQRRTMVDRQIRTFDVTDQALIERMLDVPRETFLPPDLASLAYCDGQLQVAAGNSRAFRKLVAPLALARLIQSANLAPQENVLVVGDGPAYTAALVAGLTASVVALEVEPAFTEMAHGACAKLGIDNVAAVTGPLASGYPQMAPYDVIFILGVIEIEPRDLCAQLSNSGRILTFRKPPGDPVGRAAKAVRISRIGDEFCARPLFDAAASVIDAFRAKAAFVF